MMKRKYYLLLIVSLIACASYAQSNIQFNKYSKWQDIVAKAKAENKYIFVECYATWCIPCRMMDKQVYNQQRVAEAFNDGFINVKIQIDRTKTDDPQIRNQYAMASEFENNYHIQAFPTFLFFDSNGKLVIQRSGAMDTASFIQLGKDAKKPDLFTSTAKSFYLGKLNLDDELELINVYATSDKSFAGRVAADYLSRIHKSDLNKPINGKLMIQFSDDPQVLNIAIDFIQGCLVKAMTQQTLAFIYNLKNKPNVEKVITQHFKGLQHKEFGDSTNLKIAAEFLFYPGVRRSAINYIQTLTFHEIGKESNLSLISQLNDEPKVQLIVEKFFAELDMHQIYTRQMLNFISTFTSTTGTIGMDIFYRHAKKANAIINNNEFSRDQVIFGILKKDFDPVFEKSKQSGCEPDWRKLSQSISIQFGADYAESVVDYARMNWFLYLCRDKKQRQYLTQYISSTIIKMQRLRNDTVSTNPYTDRNLNTISYGAFGHVDDSTLLKIVVNWMQGVTARNPNDKESLDTYACLLFKTGKPKNAIATEEKVLLMAKEIKDDNMIKHASITIDKMKNDELFWKEKEYQE